MAKSKYETNVKDKLILVEGWARNGLTDEQIAKNLGIGYSTLKEYKKKYPAFLAALKKGKEVIDFEVENALLKRALGYKYKEVTKELVRDPETKEEELKVTKEVIKEVVPDTTAQIFWLKNRKPEEWRDKQNIEHSGNMNVNNPFENLTTEQLLKLAGEDDG
ncbi:transposase [Clostridium sp. K25]|uniref:transposase n=1 Tax=Clostridium sp. K25 TaxID=1443109 RepID=UPI0004D4AA57|nr:transposase [Clostridium sp. K25]KEI10533.1 transposase [Clostridium sp. K25]